jgi:hypothetical protein
MSLISAHSSRINAWSDGVKLSSSIAHKSSGPSSIIVNVRFIIEPLVFFPNLVIAPYSLFRIRLKSFIIFSNSPASFRCFINGSYRGLCALKSPNNTALSRSSVTTPSYTSEVSSSSPGLVGYVPVSCWYLG